MRLDRVIAVRTGKIVYRDGETCVKVFDRDFSKADILHEAMNQARTEEAGLPVPAVRGVETVDGKWAIVSAYIRGRSFDRLMCEKPGQREEYLASLVALQRRVQALEAPFFDRLTDKLERRISCAGLDAATRAMLLGQLKTVPQGETLCHADFVPSNLVATETGEVYILDWSHAVCGNAAADAAATLLSLWTEAGDPADAQSYLSLYCAQSATEKEEILRWLPLMAAAKLKRTKGESRERCASIAQCKEIFTF